MDLIQAAWMIRDLGQPVSAIHIGDESSLIAGGWDGALKKWDKDGSLVWAVQCEDRIETILRIKELVIVTSGLHITCVKQGEIQWSNPLEGSADLLCYHDGQIVATSSVYDIEHGDFMESAIWKFSLDGELIDVSRMDERPWFVQSTKDLIFGLGRPKCGLLIDDAHHELSSNSPVTCGASSPDNALFGHADGTISSIDGTIAKEESSIESLVCTNDGFIAALESGVLISRGLDATEIWRNEGAQITTQSIGFNNLHWCGRSQVNSGIIEVRSIAGEIIAKTNTTRPRVSAAIENRVAIGFEDGQILVWEMELFERRSNEKSTETDGRRSAMAAKLRSLRE